MQTENRIINTTFPVHLPEINGLLLPAGSFAARLAAATSATATAVASHASSANEQRDKKINGDSDKHAAPASAFMTALNKTAVPSLDEHDGKMLTENADVAYRTSGDALVDLFFEMESTITGARLAQVLEKSWAQDPTATLKIIWNARSIHLGKGDRNAFYRALGWLYQHHPYTLLHNLPWLVRPLMLKKAPKPDAEVKDDKAATTPAEDEKTAANTTQDEEDFEMVDAEQPDKYDESRGKKAKIEEHASISEFDIKFGVAHGYWKDLLNILALAANGELKVDGDPAKVLNIEQPKIPNHKRDWTDAKDRRKAKQAQLHKRTLDLLATDSKYKYLHLTVARLFGEQLRTDLARLQSGALGNTKHITLAAKWAPSHKGMHDCQTTIVSSIAEYLHPFDSVCANAPVDPADRTMYLKYAREAYQKSCSSLRKFLSVVERDISAKDYEKIDYGSVPSLAMNRYGPLFAKSDTDRFDAYLDKVLAGEASISGAVLLPSTLVHAVTAPAQHTGKRSKLMDEKAQQIKAKTAEGQWNALVQRIKDSGTLESSIAVCDVSGSMDWPQFADGTVPMDSSIGLSLLIAEVTKPPFGGSFITFHTQPEVLRVGGPDDKRSFQEKVQYMKGAPWGGSTDFVAVFRDLVLPMAIRGKMTQEELPKQVFVFSDMDFNTAHNSGAFDEYGNRIDQRWTTSYERVQQDFKDAGYEMPKLVFWNLAGGAGSVESFRRDGDPAPKPITAAEEGTALVSGYSQGQLKMFLDKGTFAEAEEDVEMEEPEDEDGEVVGVRKQKAKQDSKALVAKAISHDAYRMLKVVD